LDWPPGRLDKDKLTVRPVLHRVVDSAVAAQEEEAEARTPICLLRVRLRVFRMASPT
jgi:hypothetical protein